MQAAPEKCAFRMKNKRVFAVNAAAVRPSVFCAAPARAGPSFQKKNDYHRRRRRVCACLSSAQKGVASGYHRHGLFLRRRIKIALGGVFH